jgi:hypothetical protein
MKLSTLLETVEDLINIISTRNNIPPEQIKEIINKYSVNPKYSQFVIRQWAKSNIRLPEDGPRIKETLTNFHSVKPRLPNKDLLSYKTLNDLENAIEPLIGSTSKRKGGSDILDPTKLPGVELVATRGNYRSFEIDNVDSLKQLGEGTKWCTRGSYGDDCMAGTYIHEYDHIYQIWDGNKPIIQFTSDFDQIMDVNDDAVRLTEYVDLVPTFPLKTMKELSVPQEPTDFEGPLTDVLNMLRNYMVKVYRRENSDYEQVLINYNKMSWAYIYSMMIGKRCPKLERLISREGEYAIKYAIKYGRVPIFEKLIIRWYSGDIIQYFDKVYLEDIVNKTGQFKRWPELEKSLLESFEPSIYNKLPYGVKNLINTIIDYCHKLGFRWVEAEPFIIKYGEFQDQIEYMFKNIKAPWPELRQHYLDIDDKNSAFRYDTYLKVNKDRNDSMWSN